MDIYNLKSAQDCHLHRPKNHSLTVYHRPHWCFPMVVCSLCSLCSFTKLYSAPKNFSKTFCSVLKLQNHTNHTPSGVCHIHHRGLPLNTSYDPLHNHSRRTKDSPRTIASVLTLSRAYRWFIRVLPMIDEKDKRTLLLTKLFQNISF